MMLLIDTLLLRRNRFRDIILCLGHRLNPVIRPLTKQDGADQSGHTQHHLASSRGPLCRCTSASIFHQALLAGERKLFQLSNPLYVISLTTEARHILPRPNVNANPKRPTLCSHGLDVSLYHNPTRCQNAHTQCALQRMSLGKDPSSKETVMPGRSSSMATWTSDILCQCGLCTNIHIASRSLPTIFT
jgi:hypothetical protein